MSAQKKLYPRPPAVTRNDAANDSRFAIPDEPDDGHTKGNKGNLTMLAVGIVGVAALVAVLAVAGYSFGNILFTLGAM